MQLHMILAQESGISRLSSFFLVSQSWVPSWIYWTGECSPIVGPSVQLGGCLLSLVTTTTGHFDISGHSGKCCGPQSSQPGKTIKCFSPLAACIIPLGTVGACILRGGFQVTPNLIPQSPMIQCTTLDRLLGVQHGTAQTCVEQQIP